MKRSNSTAALGLVIFSALSFNAPVSAGEQVPFKGRLEGDVTRTVVPPLVYVDVDATGNSTELGRFTLEIPHVVNLVTRTALGSYQFTAANGDTVHAEFIGYASPTDIPGVLHIEELAIITGGTGRFAGATGSFITDRWYDTIVGTTIGSFEGTISAPSP